MKKEFLDLGQQPIANKFLHWEEVIGDTDDEEFFFDLKVVFDEETNLVSLKEFVKPELMFNEDYKYNTSLSVPMVDHFKKTAELLKELRKDYGYETDNVLEIGSNDGPFVSNFENAVCVEPCDNFVEKTEELGYKTYNAFWTTELAENIVNEFGKMDLIYSANCICHIQDLDDCFQAVKNTLSEKGMFVFEDPSLLRMMERGSYDQIYDEHAHVFSVLALKKILARNDLQIFRVDDLSHIHGGSNRIYVRRMNINSNMFDASGSVFEAIRQEKEFGLDKFETYEVFANRVEKSKNDLIEKLNQYKKEGKKVASYGATSKSTTVFNYCGIGTDLIDLISDTTPDKIGLYAPGSHIPVKNRSEVNILDYDVLFLGAWNFKDTIANKEQEFIKKGGKFLTHVPQVMEFS